MTLLFWSKLFPNPLPSCLFQPGGFVAFGLHLQVIIPRTINRGDPFGVIKVVKENHESCGDNIADLHSPGPLVDVLP